LTTPKRGHERKRTVMEKINIYVPESVGRILNSDAALFEIFKRDGRTVNKNRFLSMLITGYYSQYVSEFHDKYDSIMKILSSVQPENRRMQMADEILKTVILPEVPARKGRNPKKLSLKPTKDTESLIIKIMTDLGDTDFISQYFCRLMMSYCDRPLNEREQIIFRNNYEMLAAACEAGKPIAFTTIWNRTVVHEVVPYKVVVGQGEMFNYLICAEKNVRTGEQEAKSYRLNRITNLNYSSKMDFITKLVKSYLDMMLRYGPQFAINSDEEICVKLTNAGEKSYNRIYYGRPTVDHIEHDGDNHYYYFKCAQDQIFLYFRRFTGDSAEIIRPVALRQQMQRFHKDALEQYLRGREDRG